MYRQRVISYRWRRVTNQCTCFGGLCNTGQRWRAPIQVPRYLSGFCSAQDSSPIPQLVWYLLVGTSEASLMSLWRQVGVLSVLAASRKSMGSSTWTLPRSAHLCVTRSNSEVKWLLKGHWMSVFLWKHQRSRTAGARSRRHAFRSSRWMGDSPIINFSASKMISYWEKGKR